MQTLDLSLKVKNPNIELADLSQHSVDEENEVCIEIFHMLMQAFKECERYSSKYLNLIAIFFPDLMRISTSCVLKYKEIEKAQIRREEKKTYSALSEFPFCGYRELLEGTLNITSKHGFSDMKLTGKIKFLNNIGKIFKRVCYYGYWPIGKKREVDSFKYILKHLSTSKIFPVFPQQARIHIPRYENQHAIVSHFFENVIERYKIPVHSDEFVNLFDLVYSHFIADKEEPAKYQVLVTGTLQRRITRILAAHARSQDIPVITVSHGEGDQLIVDEPRIGFGEFTCPSFFIGYGTEGQKRLSSTEYTSGLYEKCEYVPSNSDVCKKIYNPSREILKLSDLTKPTYMYVPTTFEGGKRYGPFHNLPDVVYYEWQRRIHELFPEAIYKSHPKLLKIDMGFKEVEEGYFEECHEAADVYIFDVIATAFNIAAATNKPIIYFDIGVRNIFPDVAQLLKERCIWVDARENKACDYLRSEIDKQRDKTLRNNYTEKYCIVDSDQTRQDVVIETIKRACS